MRLLILAPLLLAVSACATAADDATPAPAPPGVELQPPAQPAISIQRDVDGNLVAIRIHGPEGAIVAIIWPNGTVETLNGTPDEAARAFWAAISQYIKSCSKL